MNRERISLLLWCLVCLIVFCTFLPAVMLERNSRVGEHREPYAALVGQWEIGFGPERPEDTVWKPFNADTRLMLKGYKGTVWLQRTLPELNWRNPYLFLARFTHFEVMLNQDSIYRFHKDNASDHINGTKLIHPVQINPQDAGKQLLIRTEWEGDALFGNDWVLAGEPDQILYALIRSELTFVIYGTLSVAAGFVGLAMFIRRKVTLYGWFALFNLSMGLSFLFSCRLMQWFIDMEHGYYWNELLTPLAIWGCIGFYTSALNAGRRPLILIVHAMMGVYGLASVAAAITLPRLYMEYRIYGNATAAVAGFIIVAYALTHYKLWAPQAANGDRAAVGRQEQLWLMRGNSTFTLCATSSLVLYTMPGLLTEWLSSQTYWYRISEGLLPNALFLFIICMSMVIVSRVRRVHQEAERSAAELLVKNKELEQFHRNLEQLVHTRTGELEQANRNLALTLREKAETLAEKSVLEERNRIAYEMHDVVGHTLTAAIVQIEATKTLAERNGGLPMEKMDLLSELVRKGLNDIRQAVRIMKADDDHPPMSLESSLRELIQYTEDTMDIRIETDISLPPAPALGALTERVLYHALQEGLTNSIRHGKCACVRFSIRTAADTLHFQLISDGEPFGSAVPGFGLTAMMERVELLGGEVYIRSSADADGTPMGCELSIRLPLH
ncbi:sensor histidine kinase [Paenibacillus oceani]|uniref:histidine kinase n=1 Tax=Paenibacillus oceani TaxID=2772510 RepID=A0A927CCR9_9BACL|nr:histidine kinase [Paenibacillus oceani]MBD2865679.1 hypothetical protein [Paenibacillus oceani]